MTKKMKTYLMAGVVALALAVGSAILIGVDETLELFEGLANIAGAK